MALAPDSRKRLSIAQCTDVEFDGNPDSVTISYASGAEQVEVKGEGGKFSLPLSTLPELLDVSWSMGGVTVTAQI